MFYGGNWLLAAVPSDSGRVVLDKEPASIRPGSTV